MDAHYEIPELVELYDLDSGWSSDRDFYLKLAGSSPKAVLDLGCGTGLLCDAYAAHGHKATGVDPSAAMLGVARTKPNAGKVTWVQAFAEDFRSNERFDLVIMTGHAFQVLLSDAEILRALQTMRAHLKPHGLVAFESRNPAFDWRAVWDCDLVLEKDGRSIVESRRLLGMEGGRITFEMTYRFADKTLVSRSVLNCQPWTRISSLLSEAGLSVERILGDWDQTPFDAETSPEMIFMARMEQ